jgi:acetoin:2,6-dichlorophenolindophenol oxidoreductase subunit alpha
MVGSKAARVPSLAISRAGGVSMADPLDCLIDMYRWMILCRELETACARVNPRWFPATGEEATIVGAFYGLRPDDVIAPHYRGPFVAYLMRGAELDRLVGQALGKVNGYSKGRSVPFTGPVALGIVPWVAGDLGTSLSVATGAALSIAYNRENGAADDRIVVVSFGDGTANRGDFHEAINLAAVWKLPIVFVCQNNQYAISLHASTYLPISSIAVRAQSYGIPGVPVDGNDPVHVADAVANAATRARSGAGPSLIEARTYRLEGHWAEDGTTYRASGEAEFWRTRDPLAVARKCLVTRGYPAERIDDHATSARAEVEAAFARVRALPDTGPEELGSGEVFAT